MLAFIVPLKPRRYSKNWEQESAILERTIKSICAQTSRNFRVYLVFTDKPFVSIDDENFMACKYPFDFIEGNDINDLERFPNLYGGNIDMTAKMMDKSKKITYGAKIAKQDGCKYIMAFDGDDLVSKRICRYVETHSGGAGWRIAYGYIHLDGTSMLHRNSQIYNLNGSTHIIREDLVKIPSFDSRNLYDYNLFLSHGYTYGRIRDESGLLLDDIPFPGVVYVAHENNFSGIRNLIDIKNIRNLLKYIIRGRMLTNNIKKEFGLYKLKK